MSRHSPVTESADFDPIVVAHDTLFSTRFIAKPALDSAFREAWRFQILVFALYLHDMRGDDPRSGLTLGKLQALLAEHRIASRGRVAAVLKQLEAEGLLMSERSAIDRRVVLLIPTASLITGVALWERVMLELIERVSPADDLAIRARLFPRFGEVMRHNMVKARFAGWSPLNGFPEVAFFSARHGGWRLLSRLMALALAGGLSPVRIDLELYARETGASPAALRRLLLDAWKAGLLDAPPRGGHHIVPSARLVTGFRAYLAAFIEAHRRFAIAAAEELAA